MFYPEDISNHPSAGLSFVLKPIIAMMSRKIWILVPFLLSAFSSFGQLSVSGLRLSGHYVPSSHYIMPNGDENLKTSSTTIQSRYNIAIDFNLSTHVDTLDGSMKLWFASVNADQLRMLNTGYLENVFPPVLTAATVSVQHLRSLKNRWSLLGLFSCGINSDFRKIDTHDIFALGGLIFIKRYTPQFSMGFGLLVNNSLGMPVPWPALTVNWEMGHRYKLNIDVPDKAPGLAYKISFSHTNNKKNTIAAFFKPSSMSYDVEGAPQGKRLLNYWQIPVGLEFAQRFKQFDISVNGGLMALRSFGYADKNWKKMFAQYPYHQLGANYFLGLEIRHKMSRP
jgi:hypothetical protein